MVLHLGKHIERMVAAGVLNDGSLDAVDPVADETISQS